MIRKGLVIASMLVTTILTITGCGGGGGNPDNGGTNVSGLDSRPANTTCIAPDRPASSSSFTTTQVFDNLQFTAPIAMLQAPGDASRWFIVEQAGTIRVFDNNPNVLTSRLFLDISTRVTSGGERGLLGMAFHPDFASNGQVFISYTTTVNNQLLSRISRFYSTDSGLTLDDTTEEILLAENQPFSNHNGGHIAFGPDNYLYIGLGDGGSGGDPQGHGQDTTTLLGALLRIDVDNGTPYAIPADNPFRNDPPNRAEIFAWGLRNPWRWSFDKATGQLWLGDVGQGQWEEINLIRANGNYGWNIREGAHCYNDPTESCNSAGLLDPLVEYDHTNGGRSVTGGYVYRGSIIPELQGAYIYGDFTNGKIWYLPDSNTSNPAAQLLQDSSINISSFAQDQDGEVYVVNYAGTLHKVVYQSNSNNDTIPALLSMTGCVDSNNTQQAAAGMIPYNVNAAFWSDGASKQRWLAIPDSTTITINAAHDWEFPPGSVLMKHFSINNRLIETRLLMRHTDGSWGGYSYEWNDQETDASLVRGGKTKDLGSRSWYYPGSSDCLQCHTQAAGFSLGPETAQLNRSITYPRSGRIANQLDTLDAIGMFSSSLSTDPAMLAKLAEPFGNDEINVRARAWLHTNCAQCHQSNGPTPVTLDLRYTTPMNQTGLCNLPPQSGGLGLGNPRIIAPGIPSSSVLLTRIQTRDANSMPPLGSLQADASGITLMQTWIAGMNNSCE
jgi:uncharacterized repeat protein (TIGR03806 family)